MKLIGTLLALIGVVIGILALAAIFSFIVAAIITPLWNVVISHFGGTPTTYWVSYAGYWLLVIIGGILKGITTSTKK